MPCPSSRPRCALRPMTPGGDLRLPAARHALTSGDLPHTTRGTATSHETQVLRLPAARHARHSGVPPLTTLVAGSAPLGTPSPAACRAPVLFRRKCPHARPRARAQPLGL